MSSQLTDLISAVGLKEGKPEPALLAALEDKIATRRAAAVVALGEATTDDTKTLLRKMYKDTDPEVHLRAAQALIGLQDNGGGRRTDFNLCLTCRRNWRGKPRTNSPGSPRTRPPTCRSAPTPPAAPSTATPGRPGGRRTARRSSWSKSDPAASGCSGYTPGMIEGFDLVEARRQGRVTELDASGKVLLADRGAGLPHRRPGRSTTIAC